MDKLEQDALLKELAAFSEEVPPEPEELHGRWMQAVEEEAMEQKNRIPEANETKAAPVKRRWVRWVSAAAACLLLIGGTAATRNPYAHSSAPQTAAHSRASANVSGLMMSKSSSSYAAEGISYDTDYAYDEAAEAPYSTEEAAAEDLSESTGLKKIIRSLSITLETEDWEADRKALQARVNEFDGWVQYSYEGGSEGDRYASLTVRIPEEKVDAFLSAAEGLGKVTSRSESSTDVTNQYYDIQTRLTNQRALMTRLQELTTDAATLSDLLALESQMASTQSEIDSLTGILNGMDSRVSYATVDINLTEKTPIEVKPDPTFGERLADALKSGAKEFVWFMEDMLLFITASLPFFGVLAAAIVLILVIRRIRRHAGQKKA